MFSLLHAEATPFERRVREPSVDGNRGSGAICRTLLQGNLHACDGSAKCPGKSMPVVAWRNTCCASHISRGRKTFVKNHLLPILAAATLITSGAFEAHATVIDVSVQGTDAIFLAGRTDVVIPAANLPWTGPGTHLIRHGGNTPEEAKETTPTSIAVAGGDVIRVLDPAIGGINFFNGFGPPFFGPSGNTPAGS